MSKKLSKQQEDGLAEELVSSINTKFKNYSDKSAFMLADPDVSSDVTEWVDTGSDLLNLAISNRPNGGWPVGRISEITGLEASGKSLLAAYALKSTQQKGGLAIYIDTEAATSRDYLTAIGVDVGKLLYIQLEKLEDIFESIEIIIGKIRTASKDRLVTIVVDSIMGATTEQEVESNYEKEGWNTSKAIILSKAMRKITNMIARQRVCLILTNQLRVRLGVSFGDPYCVDPFTTKFDIMLAGNPSSEVSWTLANIGKTFLELKDKDFYEPKVHDISHRDLLVKSKDQDGNIIWNPLLSIVIKEKIDHNYTDGNLRVSGNHILIGENGEHILAQDHPEFVRGGKPIAVADVELGGNHTYLSGGRLHHNTTSGGKAIPFHSSVRLRLKQAGQIKFKDVVAGIKTEAAVQKNRVGPPHRKVVYDIYFDSGIDNYGSWLSVLKTNEIITGTTSYQVEFPEMEIVNPKNGDISKTTLIKFKSKEFARIIDANPNLKNYLYNKLCEVLIMKYKSNEDFGIDDVKIETDFVSEED